MANAEWERLKEALRQPATPEAMLEAAEAFKEYRVASLAKGGSKPTLVSLGRGRAYPNAVSLDRIADELAKNPQFFLFMKKVVAREKG